MARRVRVLFATATALVLLLPSVSALAYEDEVTLGLEAGYGRVLGTTPAPEQGPVIGLTSSVGIGDVWSVRGRLSYGVHPGTPSLHLGVAGAEVLYLLDVLEWVPYFGAGLDGLFSVSGGNLAGDLAAHAVVGIEWVVSWDWLLALEARPYVLPLELGETGLDPVYLTVTVRASLRFSL
jgi:hypothetical protein